MWRTGLVMWQGDREEGRAGRGHGRQAEVRGWGGGGGWAVPPGSPKDCPLTLWLPTLTSFSLPGANGFPCCGKGAVDIVEIP